MVCDCQPERLPDCLALFLLEQSDTGDDFPLGGNSVSVKSMQIPLRIFADGFTGFFHDCCQSDLYPDGRKRLPSASDIVVYDWCCNFCDSSLYLSDETDAEKQNVRCFWHIHGFHENKLSK